MPLFGKKKEVGSTQDILKFAEIRDGTVILKDGNLRSVLLCTSINFDLKSQQEQDAIIYQYQNFLNSLEFPIQILMQSKKLDLSNYLEKLQKNTDRLENELLKYQSNDYIHFVTELIDRANIMDKRFYVVVPYLVPPKIEANQARFPGKAKTQQIMMTLENFKKYAEQLEQRIEVVQSGLASIGIKSVPLSTQQTIELLYNVYNPEESNKEKLIDSDQLQGEIVQKVDKDQAEQSLEKENE